MNKKKIIIIAAVAALLFILYRRGTFDSLLGKVSGGSDSTDTDVDVETSKSYDLEVAYDSIAQTSMNAKAKNKCKELVRGYLSKAPNLGTTVRDGKTVNIYDLEVQSAKNYGITFEQQAVRSCINMLHQSPYELFDEEAAKTYMAEVVSQ